MSDVDDWFEASDHPLKPAMRRAREIILAADPRVTESIKWKTPTFAYKGNIASFNPSKNVISIMFHRGAEIPGDHPRLEGDGKLVRTMRFGSLDELEAGARTWNRPSAPGAKPRATRETAGPANCGWVGAAKPRPGRSERQRPARLWISTTEPANRAHDRAQITADTARGSRSELCTAGSARFS